MFLLNGLHLDFMEALKNGIVLCYLMREVRPLTFALQMPSLSGIPIAKL
jgi:hypothetical protein